MGWVDHFFAGELVVGWVVLLPSDVSNSVGIVLRDMSHGYHCRVFFDSQYIVRSGHIGSISSCFNNVVEIHTGEFTCHPLFPLYWDKGAFTGYKNVLQSESK